MIKTELLINPLKRY